MNEQTLQNAFNKLGYEYEGFLGDGSFGKVCQVSERSGSPAQKFAIKLLDTTKRDNDNTEKYNKREVKLLATLDLSKENVVQFYGLWNMDVGEIPCLCIKMELCWRNLGEFVYDNDMGGAEIVKAPSKPRLYQQVFPQILKGIIAIHSKDWVHRDIHPGNILIATPKPSTISEIKIKIADFGLARKIESTQRDESTMEGLSPFSNLGPFSAPELSSQRYNKKVDLYSAGVVLYFLSRYVKNEKEWKDVFEELKHQAPFYNHLCFQDDALITLIKSLTQKNRKDRKTAEEALEMMEESACTSLQDTENSPSTGSSFIVQKDGERYWRRGTCKKDTLSSLKDEIYERTDVEPKLQKLFQETEITVKGGDAPQPMQFNIDDDKQVQRMFLSASKEQKRVCVIVQESMDISS